MTFTDVLFEGRTPRIVAILPSYIASCQINVIKPLSALARAGHIKFKHVLEQNAGQSLIAWAELIVFCRNTEPGFRHLLSEAIGRRKPVIYDIDDSFWDVSASTDPELANYHQQPSRLRQFESYLSHANLVHAYSPSLRDRISRFNPNTKLYRASFDFSLAPSALPLNAASAKTPISIVYATSRTVDDQYKVFLPGLTDFLSRYPNSAHVTVWGCSPPELSDMQGVTIKKFVSQYESFLRDFARSSFEIGFAPLDDSEFNRSKNNTKFRDYGACGVAGIYSDVDAYTSSVSDAIDGLIVQNTRHAWFSAIERLVFDQALRAKIQTNAREKVFNEYRQELIERRWLMDIHALLADAPSFWLSHTEQSDVMKCRILAEHDHLSGIQVSKARLSSEKLNLELQSAYGSVLRSLSSSVANYDTEKDSVTFAFTPIQHSSGKPFDLKITGIAPDRASHYAQGADIKLIYDPVE